MQVEPHRELSPCLEDGTAVDLATAVAEEVLTGLEVVADVLLGNVLRAGQCMKRATGCARKRHPVATPEGR